MDLSIDDFDAAKAGEAVKIDSKGQTFYLLSQELYEQLLQLDDSPVTREDIDLLADEADAIISRSETDEY
jgi:hypothetical protein